MAPDDTPGPVGPFIPSNYVTEPIDITDQAISSAVAGLSLITAGFCSWQGWRQTTRARSPQTSVYVWMIWIEIAVSLGLSVEVWLYSMKVIRPGFALYFTILLLWTVQVQVLLQIIINRVRVISTSKRFAKKLMIGTAVIVGLINISVFNIWIPARLQISQRYIFINEIWDRIEKVIYLFLDVGLNAYFIRQVRRNLTQNGLSKYNKLLRFNVRIIFVSLLMDVMIIAAMSIPNSFVYTQFHPLAYLVKLGIEMSMADLIRKIAISSSKNLRGGQQATGHHEFMYFSSSGGGTHGAIELNSHGEASTEVSHGGIRKTEEIRVQSSRKDGEQDVDVEVISTPSTSEPSNMRVSADGDDERPIRYETWANRGGLKG